MTQQASESRAGEPKPAYVAPSIRAMDEEEILKTFQLTSAMSGWWTPGGSPIG